ncbi:MAG: hypothetical protein M1480_13900 [Bacteroidetes bacterium]|nr:hypothetical protein [Bacteroidota bacterium]
MIGIAFWIYDKSTSDSPTSSKTSYMKTLSSQDEDVMNYAGLKGNKIYVGTNWFNEELKGRVDEDGNIYKGTNWFSEEKIGRIDNDGTIYKGTSFFNEEKTGRIDKEGNIYKGSNWFNEEKQGRTGE